MDEDGTNRWKRDNSYWKKHFFGDTTEDIPLRVDWDGVQNNCIGKYRNQGKNWTCCEISCTGSAESAVKRVAPERFQPLSLTQVLDCVPRDKSKKILKLPQYIVQMGLHKQIDYPYNPAASEGCRMKNLLGEKMFFLKSFETYSRPGVPFMIRSIAQGPIVGQIFISTDMHYYGGRTLENRRGVSYKLNHVVQVVGYNLNAPIPYFIILNSYGRGWGLNGRMQISMFGNSLGIEQGVVAVPVYDAAHDDDQNRKQDRALV